MAHGSVDCQPSHKAPVCNFLIKVLIAGWIEPFVCLLLDPLMLHINLSIASGIPWVNKKDRQYL
jgi:hypothetical protein